MARHSNQTWGVTASLVILRNFTASRASSTQSYWEIFGSTLNKSTVTPSKQLSCFYFEGSFACNMHVQTINGAIF